MPTEAESRLLMELRRVQELDKDLEDGTEALLMSARHTHNHCHLGRSSSGVVVRRLVCSGGGGGWGG